MVDVVEVGQPLESQAVRHGHYPVSGRYRVDIRADLSSLLSGFEFPTEVIDHAVVAVGEPLVCRVLVADALGGDDREELGETGLGCVGVDEFQECVEDAQTLRRGGRQVGVTAAFPLLEYREQQLALGREVVQQAWEGEADLVGDVGEGGRVVAAVREELASTTLQSHQSHPYKSRCGGALLHPLRNRPASVLVRPLISSS